ncbi:hypothetical protein ASZ90_007275 [hydrocarbon metagenome]|uniref:Uncharacterized protein n=1 Tax=hydrocarbon metagenome TaxID=938273 RepID=A0A0W8FQ80_9ZZZZ
MSPELKAPLERICAKCMHYMFKHGNPNGWNWAYCDHKQKWFPDNYQKPGERKGCDDWA